jgi:hypothetical protein
LTIVPLQADRGGNMDKIKTITIEARDAIDLVSLNRPDR